MKSILYFVLAILTIVYIGFLCYVNIAGATTGAQYYISVYGGLCIALAYAAINLFGNPLKIVFFVLLIIAVILLFRKAYIIAINAQTIFGTMFL